MRLDLNLNTPEWRQLHATLQRLERTILLMGEQTNAAVQDLIAEVQDSKTKLEGLTTIVRGFPAVVAAAVAEALSNANVDDATAAAAIESATQEISDAVDQALAASEPTAPVVTDPFDPPAEPTA